MTVNAFNQNNTGMLQGENMNDYRNHTVSPNDLPNMIQTNNQQSSPRMNKQVDIYNNNEKTTQNQVEANEEE